MAKIRIREVLREYNVTIEELSNRLEVHRQTIYYYIEQDDKNPVSQLQKIADAIGCNLSELFQKKNTEGLSCPHCKNEIKVNLTK